MRKFLIAFAVLMASIPLAAHAQERFPKWYVGVEGAMTFVDSTDLDTSIGNADIDFDTGYGVGLSLGYMPGGTGTFVDGMRFDLEYYYRNSGIDTLAGATASNDLTSSTAMINAYYDFTNSTHWVPYIGAGVGYSQVTLDAPGVGLKNEDDNVFAYNLMAGIGYAPETLPNTIWSIGYRYFATEDPEYATTTGVRVSHDYEVHNIEVGLRMMF